MSPHNKRGKAKEAAAKSRRAALHQRHGTRTGTHAHHHSGNRGGGGSYLDTHTSDKQNRVRHTYDSTDPLDQQLFDYIIVVDVEATCEEHHRSYAHEIIELPGVLIDVRTGQVDRARSFHTYVKPWRNPTLTRFCTQLTGITQETVDGAPGITEAIELFVQWYRDTIPKGAKVIFAADGPWDFKNFIHEHHILRDHVSFPSIFYEYLDIRTTFAHKLNNGVPIKLDAMLRKMNLSFEGRPHNGFDDAVNIARLAVAMMRVGCIFDFVLAIPLDDEYHHHLDGVALYRREEGSGSVDRDVVEDIAKQCYGADYFTFGQAHREVVRQYRLEHPREFSHANVVSLKRRSDRALARQRQRRWRIVMAALIAILLIAIAYVVKADRLVSAWLQSKMTRRAATA
ncbi:Exonuclease [Novymonas esmeraldas]|uniref:Exonuclease n=1 Tax=Novymonas esmeraldas TaxID=1808958 RepID=A0AAW0EPQ4_9TRYP